MNRCEQPKLSDFGLITQDPSVFYRSQWNKLPSCVFVIYRVILALYLLGFYVAYLVQRIAGRGQSFVYLTNLAFTVFVVYLQIAGLVAVIDGCILRKRNSPDMRIRHLIHWLFFNITVAINVMVSIVYWAVLYSAGNGDWLYNFHVHTVTTIVSVADLLFTAVPVRLQHAVYPSGFLAAYMVVTLVYWGTGNGPVYPFLDYADNPGVAAGAIVGITAMILVIQGASWAIYKLRVWIWLKCGNVATTPADQEQGTTEDDL